MKKYYYSVYGLVLESEMELPELPECSGSNPDATIINGVVPNHLKNILGKGILYEIANDDFLFCLDQVAKYRVRNGNEITIEAASNASSNEVRLFLLGSVIGALLHQRNAFVLHGSAVAKDNEAIIFTGSSSSGKSSVAIGLYKKGYSFISDDISVIEFSENQRSYVHPGIPQFKLWKDVLEHLNQNDSLTRIRPSLEKYSVPISHSIINSPVEVKCIISLRAKNTPGFQSEELFGARKFHQLRTHTYRLQYVSNMNKSLGHFQQLSHLSKSIRVFNLERPVIPLNIDAITDYIENHVLI